MTRGRGVCAWAGALIGVAITISPAVSAADELQFTIADGRVTLITHGAPLGEILAEWERVGGTRFVDAGGLDTVPVSLHLVAVPEAEALRLLLRPAAGYLAVPRTPRIPEGAVYDRVKILAARSRPPAPRSVAAARVATGASGAGRPADARGDGTPPPELSEGAQIERLQRLLHPRGSGDRAADTATEARPATEVSLTTPRPGMIVAPEQPPMAEEPWRRYRRPAREYDREYDPFTGFPQGDER